MIETERLILRRWRETDREPLAALYADPRVMEWSGRGLRTRAESDAQMDRFQRQLDDLGYGLLALERKADGIFLGFVGLALVGHGPPAPPGVEFVWWMVPAAWGFGFASEAALAVMADGFDRLELPEILALTAKTNLRSQAVMQRIGLSRRPDLDFDHPALAEGNPLRAHLVYAATQT